MECKIKMTFVMTKHMMTKTVRLMIQNIMMMAMAIGEG